MPQGAHIVTSFADELRDLDNRVAEMGGLAERQLDRSFQALEGRNTVLAEQAVVSDRVIDKHERDIEALAITLIGKRQPMAQDLRHITAAIKIAGDLERVGDLSKNIAKRALALAAEPRPKQLMGGIRHMTEIAQRQLKDVLDAFAMRDAVKAESVWRKDDQIDAMYNSLFRELLTYMMEDPRNIGLCAHLLFAAKNLERIGDHATNIAETTYYLVTGSQLAEDRPKGDDSSSTSIPNQ
jgi:phosphate transport system protein